MNLLFDLDGTLTDPFEGISRCISHALTAMGMASPPREDLRWCIGPPLKRSLAKLLDCDDDRRVETAVAIYRKRFGSVGLFENELYPDIPGALAALREMGHVLYVATSKPTVYAERIVAHFDLDRYFSRVYGSQLDGTLSDKTDLLFHILRCESIAPCEAVMIGDRRYDMLGALANGVRGIGVLWGYGTREELQTADASVCIDHPNDLVPALAGIQDFRQADNP
ncbi:MAG: HAD hydrolase-like protein [Desulfosarcina sp.]